MRIGFIAGNGGIGAQKGLGQRAQVDVLVGAFGKGEVSYEKELNGESAVFEEIARLSKNTQGVVVQGCVTDTRGHKRKSAVVAINGRIVGASDMIHAVDKGVSCGAALRVYETGVGRMGVAVAEDLCFPSVIGTLADCGSDFIVCPFLESESIHRAVLQASAYCFGVPIFFCAEKECMIADVTGEIVFSSTQNVAYFAYTLRKEYRLIETRRRGLFRGNKA